jgi:putative holliday junction resolvase
MLVKTMRAVQAYSSWPSAGGSNILPSPCGRGLGGGVAPAQVAVAAYVAGSTSGRLPPPPNPLPQGEYEAARPAIGSAAVHMLLSIRALRAMLARNQRLIGLDPGARTIGVALSDVSLMLASPYGSIRRGKLRDNAAEINAIALKEGAGGLVAGLPLSMGGSVGPAAQAARDWALALSGTTGLPLALWDERLSTAAVNRFLIDEADASRRRRAEVVDRMAAAWMLQAALDASR